MEAMLARILATLLLGTVVPLSAGTITVTNFDGADSHLLTDSSGALLFSGTVRLGTFALEDSEIQDAFSHGQLQLLDAQFTQFSNSVAVSFNGLPSLYQDVITQSVAADDAFAGQSVYTVITDLGSIRETDNLLIFKHDQVFLVDPLRNDPALLDDETGQLLVGEFDRYRRSLDQIVDQPAYTLARVIPEPSASALLLITLGMLARRWRSCS